MTQFHQYMTIYDLTPENNKIRYTRNSGGQELTATIGPGVYSIEDLAKAIDDESTVVTVTYDTPTQNLVFNFGSPYTISFPDGSQFWKVLGLPNGNPLTGSTIIIGPVYPRLSNEIFIKLSGVSPAKVYNLDNLDGEVRKSAILACVPVAQQDPFRYYINDSVTCREPGIVLAEKHIDHISLDLVDRDGRLLTYQHKLSDYFIILRVETIKIQNDTDSITSSMAEPAQHPSQTSPQNLFYGMM
jgi:hypothetical protein